MANSLEFSISGHPIENRYDGYGELLADSLTEDHETIYRAQDRITREIDERRAAFLASGEADDYDPFAPVETDEERRERMLNEDPYLGIYGYTEDDLPDGDEGEEA